MKDAKSTTAVWRRLREKGAPTASDVIRAFRRERTVAPLHPVPIKDLARWLGAEVEPMRPEYAREFSGMLDFRGGVPVITYREGEFEGFERFTIAHEIGHLLRHEEGKRFRDATFKGYDPRTRKEETEANRFGAALLMPLEDINVLVPQLGYDLDALARRFRVSRAAMRYRLLPLGYAV